MLGGVDGFEVAEEVGGADENDGAEEEVQDRGGEERRGAQGEAERDQGIRLHQRDLASPGQRQAVAEVGEGAQRTADHR